MTALRVHVHVCPRCWKRAPGKAHRRRRAAFRHVPDHCRHQHTRTLFGAACPLVELLAKFSPPMVETAPAAEIAAAGEGPRACC